MTEGELILYTSEDGSTSVRLRAEGGTVWLTQLELAELFQTTVPNINQHIKSILSEGELTAESTIKDYLIVRQEGTDPISDGQDHIEVIRFYSSLYLAPSGSRLIKRI